MNPKRLFKFGCKQTQMNREAITERPRNAIHQPSEEKAAQISGFADFVLKQYEDRLLIKGIAHLTANSKAFDFLNDGPALYSEADVKGPYHG